jgi:hypothetical protein
MYYYAIDYSIAGIILGVCTLIWTIFWAISSSKKTAFNAKEIEKIKGLNSQKSHISIARYDSESEVYHKIFNPFINLIIEILQVFPAYYDSEEDKYSYGNVNINNESNQNLIDFRSKFIEILYGNAVFIGEFEFNLMLKVDKLCYFQIEDYEMLKNEANDKNLTDEEYEKILNRCFERSVEIIKIRDEIIDCIRISLCKLKEVID